MAKPILAHDLVLSSADQFASFQIDVFHAAIPVQDHQHGPCQTEIALGLVPFGSTLLFRRSQLLVHSTHLLIARL